MNPFAQLVAMASKPRPFVRKPTTGDDRAKPLSKTGAMRAYLQEHGKATVADLAIEADLENTGLVYALLKADIAKGAIERQGNHYVWIESYDDDRRKDIAAAIRLLKSSGYSVRKGGVDHA